LPDSDILDALAAQIEDELSPVIEVLQVTPRMNFNPSPPSVDIYPAETPSAGFGFGTGNDELFYVVRVRVSTVDHDGGQDLLLSMMEREGSTSMQEAIESDPTLGGTVDNAGVSERTGFGIFPLAGGDGNLLGATWTVRVLP
jgi:hypothetical protein